MIRHRLGEFNSNQAQDSFQFSMRATCNDLRRVKVFGDMAQAESDQELPYDNEKKELSSLEQFTAGVMQSLLLTILREAAISGVALDELEGRVTLAVKHPLRTLRVHGVEEAPFIQHIHVQIFYFIEDMEAKEGDAFIQKCLHYDPLFPGLEKAFPLEVEVHFQF